MRSVRNAAFLRAATKQNPRGSRKSKSTFFPAFGGALLGAIVSIAGIWLQSFFSDSGDLKRAEREAVVAVLSFQDNKDQADSVLLLKMAMNSIRYATFSSDIALREQADFLRRNSFCENSLTEQCKRALVESVATYRRQLGLGPVNQEDLRVLLEHPMRQMEAAIKASRAFGAQPNSPPPSN